MHKTHKNILLQDLEVYILLNRLENKIESYFYGKNYTVLFSMRRKCLLLFKPLDNIIYVKLRESFK